MRIPMFPVSARELHEAAGIATPFSRWIKTRIRSLNFSKDNDYVVDEERSPRNGVVIRHYFLNVEPALEVANRMRDKQKRDRALAYIAPYDTKSHRDGRAFIQMLAGRIPLPF